MEKDKERKYWRMWYSAVIIALLIEILCMYGMTKYFQ